MNKQSKYQIVGIKQGKEFESKYIIPQKEKLENGGCIVVELDRKGIKNGLADLLGRDGTLNGKKRSYLCHKYNIDKKEKINHSIMRVKIYKKE